MWGDVHINCAVDHLIPWILAPGLFFIPYISCFDFNVLIVFETILEHIKPEW